MTAKTLLVVDDEPNTRELIARLAAARGFHVTEAGCAGEALDRLAERAAAIAICDIGLPDRDGLWLATQIRRQFPETAIIMCTDHGDRDRTGSLGPGAIAYLTKPFASEQLTDALERASDWHEDRVAAGVSGRRSLQGLGVRVPNAVKLKPTV